MKFPKTDWRNFAYGQKPCHAEGCDNLAAYRVNGLTGSGKAKSKRTHNQKAHWCKHHISERVDLANEKADARKAKRDAENKARWAKHQAESAGRKLRNSLGSMTYTMSEELIAFMTENGITEIS